MKTSRRWLIKGLFCASLLANVGNAEETIQKDMSPAETAARVSGREIFLREWLPNDPRSHGGDGLGPVFNETSCISCHNQGGVGGGGAEAKNVLVISAARANFGPVAFFGNGQQGIAVQQGPTFDPNSAPVHVLDDEGTAAPASAPPGNSPPATPTLTVSVNAVQPAPPLTAFGSVTLPGSPVRQVPPVPRTAEQKEQQRKKLIEELNSIHPGLVTARSVVLHKSGIDPKYAEWRDTVLGHNGIQVLQTSLGEVMVEPSRFEPGEALAKPDAATPADQRPQQAVGPASPPHKPTNGGFFADLFVVAREAVLREMQPPNDLLMEKQRASLARFPNVGFAISGEFDGSGQPLTQPVQRTLTTISSQRNSIALFGVGLIDSIPNAVIEAGAAKEQSDFPEISGRVARLKDGRIGRFGWKAQKANLYDFTMTACAVELGLNVPDHPQAGIPNKPDYQSTGFDLDQNECKELILFLRDLPVPTRSGTTNPLIAKELELGQIAFVNVGCAACHVSNLGDVKEIYSDLLVHDLGPELGDSGGYGVFQPQSPGDDADDPLAGLMVNQLPTPTFDVIPVMVEETIPEKMIGTSRQEWRTPPLWGVRDSAPYLHDGRAGTLEQAIAMHGGEAQLTANRFFRLPPEEKTRVLAFLRSLVAPNQ